MTAAELRLLQKLQRLAARLQPDLARSILHAFEQLRKTLTPDELQSITDEVLERAFRNVRLNVRDAVGVSFDAFAKEASATTGFDILNPRIIDAVRTLETRVIASLKQDIRDTVRQHVEAGLQAGKHPRVVAKGLRDVIGLSPRQEEIVRNFRNKLEGRGDPLENRLRDKRFDAKIRKGNLSPADIEKMTEAYRKKWVAWNAETNARTATLDANKLGQHLSWKDAIAKGVVGEEQIERTWITVGDDRVRPEHARMHGEKVQGLEASFSNGETIPGESTYNCRCIARISIIPKARVAA